MWAADAELAADLSRRVLEIALVLRDALQPDGMNIINSAGEAATQTVMHLHVHLVPRYERDAIGAIWPEQITVSDSEIQFALEKIREQMRAT